jgi:hypothetical protein
MLRTGLLFDVSHTEQLPNAELVELEPPVQPITGRATACCSRIEGAF